VDQGRGEGLLAQASLGAVEQRPQRWAGAGTGSHENESGAVYLSDVEIGLKVFGRRITPTSGTNEEHTDGPGSHGPEDAIDNVRASRTDPPTNHTHVQQVAVGQLVDRVR
jgi:hypothetical protein